MTRYRCQICGRRKPLKRDGTIVFHHVDSERCMGAGYPPIEQDDARLEAYFAAVEKTRADIEGEIRALEERRANYIPPELLTRRAAIARLWLKLESRVRRHRSWPDRYRRSRERQLYLHGYCWADPPPDYLIRRDRNNCGNSEITLAFP